MATQDYRSNQASLRQSEILNVLLIGAGRSAKVLLRYMSKDPSINIVGLVDINPAAPGIAFAKENRIRVATHYQPFLHDENLDIIVNLTDDTELQQEIRLEKLPHTVLISKKSAMLIWTTMDEDKKYQLLRQFLQPERTGGGIGGSGFIIGDTPKMKEIVTMIGQVAPTPTTVLIRGESGTGKEMVARLIHNRSPWRAKPLVTLNCTAFSSTLIESELFGYKKGAFTGAVEDRTGLLEQAHNGTLFLDEIGDMPIDMQSKLLRFLQSGEIRAIGDYQTKKVRVRIVAATNRNLEEAIRRGEFRSDLFYRLNAFTIYTPPLRDRMEDVPSLVYHFLQLANLKVKKNVTRIHPAALAAFVNYHWPGNIRELKNVIERAVVMVTGEEIFLEHLPLTLRQQDVEEQIDDADLEEGLMALKAKMINRFEYEAICRYLEANGGNVSRAAEAAKVPRRTFQLLVAKHNISPKLFKNSPPLAKTT